MGIAVGMRELSQNITASHKDRTKTIAKIKEDARRVTGDAEDLINGFQTSRRRSGSQLRKDLAGDKAGRKSDVKKLLSNAQGLIQGFQSTRIEDDAQLRKERSQGVAKRRSEVNATLGGARQTIKSYRSQRKAASTKLQGELAQSQSSRKSEVSKILEGAQYLVRNLGNSRQDAGKKLQRDLARGRIDRESEVKKMRSQFLKSRAAVRGDINEARAAWQELNNRGKKVSVTAKGVEVEPSEAPTAEEIPDLEAKLLAAIIEHPEGITLAEVADSLSVAPIVFGRAAKKLVDEGRVRKEDKAYYPAAGE